MTLEDLKEFSESVNDGNTYKGYRVILDNDIDIGSELTPIGIMDPDEEGYYFDGVKGSVKGSGKYVGGIVGTNKSIGIFATTLDGCYQGYNEVTGGTNIGGVVNGEYTGEAVTQPDTSSKDETKTTQAPVNTVKIDGSGWDNIKVAFWCL